MELPAEVVIDEILSRLPIDELLPYWESFSRVTIRKIAEYNNLPLPGAELPIHEQVLDLVASSELPAGDLLVQVALRGDISALRDMVSRTTGSAYASINALSRAAAATAAAGRIEAVTAIVESARVDLDMVMESAARNGRANIVVYISALASRTAEHVNYDRALAAAARGGHAHLVDLLMSLGASDCGQALAAAARGNQIEIIDKILECPHLHPSSYGDAMISAARGGHLPIFRAMQQLAANPDYRGALAAAARGGNLEIVRSVLRHILDVEAVNEALIAAAAGGHLEVVELMLQNGAYDYYAAMDAAASKGHANIIDSLLARTYGDINDVLEEAAASGHANLISHLVARGATDLRAALSVAAENRHPDAVNTLLSLGATWPSSS